LTKAVSIATNIFYQPLDLSQTSLQRR